MTTVKQTGSAGGRFPRFADTNEKLWSQTYYDHAVVARKFCYLLRRHSR